MSTIKMHATTKATPEQYTAGLTDFGPGRSKIFGNSADSDLKVSVYDTAEDCAFELPVGDAAPLDVYYHPYAYRDFSSVDYEDSRLAA